MAKKKNNKKKPQTTKKQQQQIQEEDNNKIQEEEEIVQENKNTQIVNFTDIEIQQALQDYSKNFSIHGELKYEDIVEIKTNYPQLVNQIENSLIQRTTSNFIIYGLQGFGRKTSVKYGIGYIKQKYNVNVQMININAYMHATEQEFVQELVQQLIDLNPGITINQKNILSDCINFTALDDYFKEIDGYTIIQVGQIEELTRSKRQVLLYNLLEWVQYTPSKVIMIGITSNLKITEEMEKRVRSRLSSDSLFFFSYDLQSLKNIIYGRFKSENQHKFDEVVQKVLKQNKISEFIERYIFQTQKPIEWGLQLFKITTCSLHAGFLEQLIKDDENYLQKLEDNLQTALQKSYDHMIPKREINLMSGLNQAELITITMIHYMIKHQFVSITLNLIISQVQQYKQRVQAQSEIQKVNCSNALVEAAVQGLIRYKMIKLEESKLEGLDNKQIILNMSFQDLNDYIEQNKADWPQFLQFLANM